MSDHRPEKDEHTGVDTTGHQWDGIRELDNPLPRWWLYVWYGTIIASVIYWILMPAWPLLNGYTKGVLKQSDRIDVAQQLDALKTQRKAGAELLAKASLEEIEKDPKMLAYANQVGASIFGDNCATCHGTGGTGAKGYPNLRDDVWLWGGKLEDIEHTIRVGVRSTHPDTRTSQMPAFGRDGLLQPNEVNDLTEYVVKLSGRPANAAAVGRAEPLFAAQCASCHGEAGKGNPEMGAPDLTDGDWLYGSKREDIHGQIWNGRGGVMPTWESRFDAVTIKALAVYIHSNAGGGR